MDANKTADQLAELRPDCPFIGPELACCISLGATKKALKDWMKRDHKNNGNP
jgi:hypothetical protein